MTLPNDLKPVKRRGRAWRIVARIGKCLLITWGVLCFLFIAGYFILPYVIIASLVPPADGRRPPPVRPVPALKTAQSWCRGDLRRKLENSTIPIHNGDSVAYLMMPYEIVVEESFDFDPYFVFFGYIQWTNPDFSDSILLKDLVLPVWRSDFFVVNRFDQAEADHYRESWYDPKLYEIQCMNIGAQYPLPPDTEHKEMRAALPFSSYERLNLVEKLNPPSPVPDES